MSIADDWHDPRGPDRGQPSAINAKLAVDLIYQWHAEAVVARTVEAARAAGLSEEMISLILGEGEQGE